MRAEGGGYNPHEDAELGGRSVLYFGVSRGGRFELTCTGNYSNVVAPAGPRIQRSLPSTVIEVHPRCVSYPTATLASFHN